MHLGHGMCGAYSGAVLVLLCSPLSAAADDMYSSDLRMDNWPELIDLYRLLIQPQLQRECSRFCDRMKDRLREVYEPNFCQTTGSLS